MKITEIEVGPIYWYDTHQDWGTYMTAAYDRGPVVRVDDKRYTKVGASWRSEFREDPKGRYAAFRRVKEDGTPEDGSDGTRVYHLTSAHIRDIMANVRARYDRQKAFQDDQEQKRRASAAEKAQQAADLRARLADLGLANSIKVESTDGLGYGAGLPHVTVRLTKPADVLADLLDRLERGRYAEAELKARKADMTPDPDFADRLANGAYER